MFSYFFQCCMYFLHFHFRNIKIQKRKIHFNHFVRVEFSMQRCQVCMYYVYASLLHRDFTQNEKKEVNLYEF